MKRILAFLLCTCVTIGLVGCKGGTQPSADAQQITFVLDWTPNTNHTGIYVAQELGYFSEQGLEVTIVAPPEDGAPALVASGKADFGMDAQDTLAAAFASEEQLPVTAVAAVAQHNDSGILSKMEDNITRPKNMEEKNYATWSNPIEQAILKKTVELDGGDFSKVRLIPTAAADVLSALSADIDAVWVYYAWDGIATQIKGIETNYFSFAKMDSVFDYYTPVLIANNDYLQKNPDTAKRFLAAVEKGYQYAIDHPQEATNILCSAVPELDPDIVSKSQNYLASRYIDDAPYWGYMDPARWNRFYQWLNENELTQVPLEMDYGFTNAYLAGK